MTGLEIAFGSIAVMLVLIYAGMHVAIALSLVSFLGVTLLKGSAAVATNMLALTFKDAIAGYVYGVIPLFVLMGYLVSVSGIGRDTFRVANQVFRRVAGGLGIATVAANAVFAAITGVSLASVTVFTKVAVPEMTRNGYTLKFATGVVAGSSVLGMLIPPSLLFILYGILTEQSVGALFVAGIVPGLLMATVFAVGILLLARFRPAFVGAVRAGPGVGALPQMSSGEMVRKLLPIVVLVAIVIGGIYGGIATPTEAGALGALSALLFALARRSLDLRSFWGILVSTGHATASVCFLIISANLYSRMLAMSGMPAWLGGAVAGLELGPTGLIVALIAVMILLGTIMDSASILLLTIPIALPVLSGMEVDLIWLGVIAVIAVEIGLLTPPFGLAIYVIKSLLDPAEAVTLGDIFRGAFPFVVMMIFVLALLVAFPVLVTGLL